jgi:hypothetical protein
MNMQSTQQGQLLSDAEIAALPRTIDRTPKGINQEEVLRLRQKGLSTTQIGKIVDCSKTNVANILAKYEVEQEQVNNYKDYRADILAGLQARILLSIDDADIKKAPMGLRVLAVSQLYDKERLERGLSTNNIDAHLMLRNDQTLDSKLSELQAMVDSL